LDENSLSKLLKNDYYEMYNKCSIDSRTETINWTKIW